MKAEAESIIRFALEELQRSGVPDPQVALIVTLAVQVAEVSQRTLPAFDSLLAESGVSSVPGSKPQISNSSINLPLIFDEDWDPEEILDLILDSEARGVEAGWITETTSTGPMARLISISMLAGTTPIPDTPHIWSPCGGFARAELKLASELRRLGHSPRVTIWDVNQRALVLAELCAFILDIPVVAELRNALTSIELVREVEADYAIADAPMGMAWSAISDLVTAEEAAGGYPWGLPSKMDATWLFAQVLAQGLGLAGRAICVTSEGPLFSEPAAEIRQRLLDTDVLDAVVLLPPGTASNTTIERSMLAFSKQKLKNRIHKVTLINARELFAPTSKGSQARRTFTPEGLDEIAKALSDPRPTRLSRTVEIEDLQQIGVSLSFPRLTSTDGQLASLRFRLKRGTDVYSWIAQKYGSDFKYEAALSERILNDLRGLEFFRTRRTLSTSRRTRPLIASVASLRIAQSRGAKNELSILEFGVANDGPWLVLGPRGASVSADAPSSGFPKFEGVGHDSRWTCAIQLTPDTDPSFAEVSLNRWFEEAADGGSLIGRTSWLGPKGSLRMLDDIHLPIMNLAGQVSILEAVSRLVAVQNQAQLDLAGVWSQEVSASDIRVRADAYLGNEDLSQRLQNWPNPVASAAWIVEAAKSDTAELETALNRFWEAVAGFHSTVLLSAIQRIPDLEEPVLHDIRSGVGGNGHLSFGEASIGLFAMMANTCAARIRSHIEVNKNGGGARPGGNEGASFESVPVELSQVSAAFGGLSIHLIEQLVSKEVVEVFERIRPLRTPGHHGGRESRSDHESRVRQMYSLIADWDRRTRQVWLNFQLVRGGASSRLEDLYDQQVELIVGNSYPFLKVQVPILDALIAGRVYMYSRDSQDAMPLRAALFEFHEWPDESKFACYYYNRSGTNGLDLKSFVFSGEAPGPAHSSAISDTIHWLEG